MRKTKITMKEVFNDPSYKGKYVALVKGKIFSADTGDSFEKVLADIEKKYPRNIPETAFIYPQQRLLVV